MDVFMNVIKKDLQVRVKINVMLDRFNRLPLEYQSKIGNDSLIQNVLLEELIRIIGTTITDLDIELKMNFSRKNYLESKNSQIFE